MHYAAYLRTSAKEQPGAASRDAQRQAIAAWVAAQAGRLVNVYVDAAPAGDIDVRPGLQQMLGDAHAGAFDALVVHHLDRLARSHAGVQAIRAMLEDDCHIQLFAVSEQEAYA